MRSPLRAIGVALLLAACSALADDVDEIRRLDKEITLATWTADAQWFEKNVADDYVLIAPNGIIRKRIDVIRELATPGVKMDPYEPLEVQIRVYGDSAVVTGRILQRFTLGRIRYANDLRYTDMWVKKRGKWLLVSGHASNVAVRR
jgi:ketosteroid isomerase-like protein